MKETMMADITMCSDFGCTKRHRCYRYMAEPSEFGQSYGAFREGHSGKGCEYFSPIQDDDHILTVKDIGGTKNDRST
jgi:hypothetical protein